MKTLILSIFFTITFAALTWLIVKYLSNDLFLDEITTLQALLASVVLMVWWTNTLIMLIYWIRLIFNLK